MKNMNRLSKLFEACNIGSLEIKNRIVMAPMVTGGYGPEGELTERIAEFYAVRARGGVGLIICQSSIIMWESRVPFRCSIYDDKFTKGFEKVAKAIHENGAKAAFQVIHHGRVLADYKHMVSHGNDIKALAPSAIPRLFSKEIQGSKDQQTQGIWAKGNAVPEEATQEDIDRVKKGFAEAGRRIKEAGFDAIEIMAGHGYLLGQFLSPLVNHRADQYGGNIENRSRFVCEVIAEIRSRVGSGFPIILRISGTDFLPGGISIDEVLGQIGFFIKSGADALHITAGEQTTSDRQYPSFIFPQGLHVSMAEAVKQKSSVPVIAVGKIHDPVFAEEILQKGKADFVAIGRPLLADPDWPNKAKEGRIGDIRPCIYCLNCINFGAHPHLLKEGISCSVNPTVLREKEFTLMTTSTPKEVMVIGGGPAGIVGLPTEDTE
jgi:2,4-dienoyl-CoA reductase (NADPH2)